MNLRKKTADAQQTLADLTAERDRIAVRVTEIEAERTGLALPALTGDETAQARLATLRTEAVELREQLKDVATAIIGAGDDVSAAETAEAAFARRQQAADWLKLADKWEAEGKRAAKALRDYCDACDTLRELRGKLAGEGATRLTIEQADGQLRRATDAGLMPVRLNSEFLAPRERIDLGVLATGWADGVRQTARNTIASADAALGTTPEGKAA